MTTKPLGTLYYFIGASGSGKDSILRQFREVYAQESEKPIVIAHRYITRESDATENIVSLTQDEFQLRLENDFFAMHWNANHLNYGIGIEINHWLTQGVSVLVNGSRAYLPNAKENYGEQLHSILVSVDDKVLKQRLDARKRESSQLIKERLQRHQQLKKETVADSEIINNSTIDNAAKQLTQIIETKG